MGWLKTHRIGLIFSALVFVGPLFFALALSTKSTCPPKQPVAWEIQGKEYSGWNKKDPKESQYIATQKEGADAQHYMIDDGYGRILESWFCEDAKLTDLALVIFTYILVVVGSFTMYVVDKTAKRTERAYIFGGGPYGERKDGKLAERAGTINDPKDFKDKKYLTIQNFGRTPAIVTGVWWGLCKEEDFPKGATIDNIIAGKTKLPKNTVNKVRYTGEFFPGTIGSEWLRYRHVWFYRSEHVGEVLFGKIEYKDIFGDNHYSTFKLLLNKDGYSDPFDDGYADNK